MENEEDLEILTLILDSISSHNRNSNKARHLLRHFDGLQGVLSANERELLQSGVLSSKVIKELRRLKIVLSAISRHRLEHRPHLEHMNAVVEYYRNSLFDRKQEHFHIMFLDKHFYLTDEKLIGVGPTNGTNFFIRDIMSCALQCNAKHLLVIHNHPGCLSYPSVPNILFTHDIIRAGAYLEINIADHLIIARDGEFSFRKNNLMDSMRQYL